MGLEKSARPRNGLTNASGVSWSGSDLVHALTSSGLLFLFSYSPRLKSLLSWSTNAEQVLGVKDVSITTAGNLFLRHAHPDDRFSLMAALEAALQGTCPYRATYRWIRPDTNALRWLHCRATLVERNGEQLFEGVISDLSEELLSFGSLPGSANSLGAMFTALPIKVLIVDQDLRISAYSAPSQEWEHLATGFIAARFERGQLLCEAFSSGATELEHACQNLLAHQNEIWRKKTTVSSRTMVVEGRAFLIDSLPQGIVFTLHDRSAEEHCVALEQALADTQVREQLTLGVLHHLGNALQSCVGQVDLIASHPEQQQLVAAAAQTVTQSLRKVTTLSQQLLMQSVWPTKSLSELDLNSLVIHLLSEPGRLRSLRNRLSISLSFTPTVLARPALIQRTLTYLLTLLLKEEGSEDALKISTATRELQNTLEHPFDAQFIELSIEAQVAALRHKKVSEDETLIELQASLSEDGVVLECSQHEQKATFTLSFPRLGARASTQETQRNHKRDPSAATILIVDDDTMVLETVGSMLHEEGYRCYLAREPRQALALARAHAEELDLILLDALMPEMDGPTLLKHLKVIRSDFTVLGFTGAQPEYVAALEAAGAEAILPKPVDPMLLRTVVGDWIKKRPPIAHAG